MLLWLHFVRTRASLFKADLGRLTYVTVSLCLHIFKCSKGPSLLWLTALNTKCFSNIGFVTQKKGADFLSGNLNPTNVNSKTCINSSQDGMSPCQCGTHVSVSLSECNASRKYSHEPSLNCSVRKDLLMLSLFPC